MPNQTRKLAVMLLALAFTISACDLNAPAPTPTVEGIDSINPIGQQPTTTATLTLTPTSSLTPTVAQIVIETPLPTWTPLPPSETPAPTETPGPYRHKVAVGETLGGIASKYGYEDPAIFREILRLNPNIPNENFLPVGQEILIPRQTFTPTPLGFDMTATALATRGVEIPRAIPTNAVIDCHIVQKDETITSISLEYNTTLEILASLNPEIRFRGCDFNIRSGGPNCSVLLVVNQCVRVPLPTPTPTSSPTPSGSETPTPTPTYAPPQVISPPDGWTVRGGVKLEWVSTRILQPDEFYYVEVRNTNNGQSFQDVTKNTSVDLPLSLLPPAGESHTVQWRVAVARRGEQGTFAVIGAERVYSFVWAN